MEYFLLWFILSVIVGAYASGKGRSGFGFFLLSIILSPFVGWLIALVSDDLSQSNKLNNGELKKCPACAELIKVDALKCKHCGESQTTNKNDENLLAVIDNLKKP